MRVMKDSGIEWIGQIPQDWEVKRAKYIFSRQTVKGYGDATVLSLYRDYGVITKDSRDDNHNVTSEDTSKYLYVSTGNLVVNKMKAWQGSVAVSKFDGIVSPAYYVYEFLDKISCKQYFHYLLRTQMYAQEFRRLSGGLRVGQWDLPSEGFDNILIPIPPVPTQQAIADYLDRQCGVIDGLVEDVNKEIEKLKEYKKALIFECVTGKREVA